jgi:hypothetical protein
MSKVKKDQLIIATFVVALIAMVGGIMYFAQNSDSLSVIRVDESALCKTSGGYWDGTQCRCGGYAGFKCPKTYTCMMPTVINIPDQMGICVKPYVKCESGIYCANGVIFKQDASCLKTQLFKCVSGCSDAYLGIKCSIV